MNRPLPAEPCPATERLEGREQELETLLAALLRARRSSLQTIWISGEAGVGKSALAAQLREPVAQAGGQFALGKCEQFAHGSHLLAPRQALSQLLRQLSAIPEPQASTLAPALQQALGPDAGALLPLLPELEALIGPQPSPSALEPHEQPQRLLSLLVALVQVLAQHNRPLVLVLDDLHWADPLSLQLIGALQQTPALSGLLLLGLFRSNEIGPGSPLERLLSESDAPAMQARHLPLSNLTSEQLQQLLARRLGTATVHLDALSSAVARSTGGNPFFVQQWLQVWQRQGPTAAPLAASGGVEAFLQGCLIHLPQPCLQLLQCLACLGSQASLALLADASGQPVKQLPVQLQPALEQGVIGCAEPDSLQRGEPHTVVGFGHDRLQQAVLALLDAPSLQATQLALARQLLASGHTQLAARLFAASTAVLSSAVERQQVLRLLGDAGTTALQQGDFASAQPLLAQALALLAPAPWQHQPELSFTLHGQLHQLAYARADYPRCDALYAELQRWARSPQELLEPAAIQVMALSNRGHYQAAVDLVAQLLDQLGLAIPLQQTQAALERELDGFLAMVQGGGLDALPPLPAAPPTGGSPAKLLNRLVPAAFFCNPPLACWLVLHSSRQWFAGDAHPARLYPLACTLLATVPARGDYTSGYQAARTALALGEASPHGLETARTRHVFSLFCQHWCEPLEQALGQARGGVPPSGVNPWAQHRRSRC